jgi:hypothetical protein
LFFNSLEYNNEQSLSVTPSVIIKKYIFKKKLFIEQKKKIIKNKKLYKIQVRKNKLFLYKKPNIHYKCICSNKIKLEKWAVLEEVDRSRDHMAKKEANTYHPSVI